MCSDVGLCEFKLLNTHENAIYWNSETEKINYHFPLIILGAIQARLLG